MTGMAETDPLDAFPCGCLITDIERRIRYANAYFEHRFGFDRDELPGRTLPELLTKASKLMLENYVLPMVMHEGECEETRMTMVSASAARVPIVVNATLRTEVPRIYWTITSAVLHDRLSEELIEARLAVEARAEKLKILSSTDELTGLINRRELEQRARVAIKDAQRAGRPVSMLVMDIDDFKAINDRHGHACGDEVLRATGRCLNDHGRETDLIARFGGEEFVIVLPGTSLEEARHYAERINWLLGAIRADGLSIKFSMGVAGVEDAGTTDFEGLFVMADRALYRAKGQGKNCIVMHTEVSGDDSA